MINYCLASSWYLSPNLFNIKEQKCLKGISIFQFCFSPQICVFIPQIYGLSQDIWEAPRDWISKANPINKAWLKFLLWIMYPWKCKITHKLMNLCNYLGKRSGNSFILDNRAGRAGCSAGASSTVHRTRLQLSAYASLLLTNCKLIKHSIFPNSLFHFQHPTQCLSHSTSIRIGFLLDNEIF